MLTWRKKPDAGANVNRTLVLEALVATLAEVQHLMGQTCPPLKATTVPIDELPMFDSKIWPVAFGMIGEKLKIRVPVDVNVFRRDKSKIPHTIEQTVNAILNAIAAKPSPSIDRSSESTAMKTKEVA
ncbi:MAG: hypothetical protein EOP84_31945 [Verrucomicrobiaceae bacterium]|nr:MAG: hypothetical protein EOP84_31945 [Verrucomicrobiaceae bacterium]